MARIVFDLDGTLIDSAPDICAAANHLLDADGHAAITLSETRRFVGGGASIFIERLRAARDISDGQHDRLLAAFIARYEGAVALTVPYPGVVAALQQLAAEGHALAICTNKPLVPALAVLRHLGLAEFFAVTIGGDSLPVLKPDPAPLYAALDGLGAGPALYVGDSEVDAETARRAEVPFLLFTEGYRRTPVAQLAPQASFSDFAVLPQLVQNALRSAA